MSKLTRSEFKEEADHWGEKHRIACERFELKRTVEVECGKE